MEEVFIETERQATQVTQLGGYIWRLCVVGTWLMCVVWCSEEENTALQKQYDGVSKKLQVNVNGVWNAFCAQCVRR